MNGGGSADGADSVIERRRKDADEAFLKPSDYVFVHPTFSNHCAHIGKPVKDMTREFNEVLE
jgi:hypothetical protein